MRHVRRVKPHHRRAWWRLWRYCRCGHRWRCPDSAERAPATYRPPVPPSRIELTELTETERAEIRALTSDSPPPPPRPRATNNRPSWGTPTHSLLTNGRLGARIPRQEHRARRGARA